MQNLNITGITCDSKSTSQQLLIGLANTGTQLLHPSGNLLITDKKGRLLQNVPLKLATILPQTTINYPVEIELNALNTGTYTANVSLEYEGGHSAKYKARFIVPQPQPSTNQALPKSATNQSLPNTGTNHAIQHTMAHDVTPNPALWDGLIPWQYIGGLFVIIITLLVALFLYRRRLFVSRKHFIGRNNMQKR